MTASEHRQLLKTDVEDIIASSLALWHALCDEKTDPISHKILCFRWEIMSLAEQLRDDDILMSKVRQNEQKTRAQKQIDYERLYKEMFGEQEPFV